jgi:hypothetical protein
MFDSSQSLVIRLALWIRWSLNLLCSLVLMLHGRLYHQRVLLLQCDMFLCHEFPLMCRLGMWYSLISSWVLLWWLMQPCWLLLVHRFISKLLLILRWMMVLGMQLMLRPREETKKKGPSCFRCKRLGYYLNDCDTVLYDCCQKPDQATNDFPFILAQKSWMLRYGLGHEDLGF